MSTDPSAPSRAEELRQEFDQAFAKANDPTSLSHHDLLMLRVAGERHALELDGVLGIYASRPLSPLPNSVPGLLGLAGLRGVLTPIYDLARVLGFEAAPVIPHFVVVRSPQPLGFAFEGFEAQVRVEAADFIELLGAPDGSAIHRAVRLGGSTLPVLHLPSLLQIVERACGRARQKDR